MRIPTEQEVALSQLLSPEASIRKLGAQALCRLKPQELVTIIQQAFLLEQDDGIAKWLALALGETGDARSLTILEERLKTLPDKDLKHWVLVACNMLRKFAQKKSVRDLLISSDADTNKDGLILSWKNPYIEEEDVKLQRRLLNSDDAAVRRWATLALGSSPNFIVDDQILEHLADPDYLVLEWTEHVISGKTPSMAVPSLIKNLTHKEPRVREWAIKALAACGEPKISRVLIRHYGSETDELCREAVIRALSPNCNDTGVVVFLSECITHESSAVIIAALIDVASGSTSFKASDTLVRKLIAKTQQQHANALELAFTHAFSLSLPLEDREVVEKMSTSSQAQEMWELLKSLPWNAERRPRTPTYTDLGYHSWRKEMKDPSSGTTVAVLIAKKEEFRSFVPLMGQYESVPDLTTGKSAYRFKVNNKNGCSIEVIALFIGAMGPERSAVWAQRLNDEWAPEILVNIGIAGGVHSDVVVGDVVVATQVDNYIADARAEPNSGGSGFEFKLAGDPFKTDSFLKNLLQNMEFSHPAAFQNWQQEGEEGLRDIKETDRASLLQKGLIRKAPVIEEGHVASGPIVGASISFVEWLRARDRSYLSLEMESVGVAVAMHEGCKKTRLLVIRGISDFGDERKKELDTIGKGKLRTLAMQNATRLLLALLHDISIGGA